MSRQAPLPTKAARRKAERRGRHAEILTAAYLVLRGYRLLKRRYKVRSGEIDLIAKRKNLIIFIEVKARPDVDQAIEAVTARARRRIERAGRQFLAAHPYFAQCGVRYDIAAVTGWRMRHVQDAWREGE